MANDVEEADADRPAQKFEALRRRDVGESSSDLADVIARGRARRVIDDRPHDDILGYGNDGLPR